jgi:ribosome-interacting GTPase 1
MVSFISSMNSSNNSIFNSIRNKINLKTIPNEIWNIKKEDNKYMYKHERDDSMILSTLVDFVNSPVVPIGQYKVMVVGYGAVGKTSLIQSLEGLKYD